MRTATTAGARDPVTGAVFTRHSLPMEVGVQREKVARVGQERPGGRRVRGLEAGTGWEAGTAWWAARARARRQTRIGREAGTRKRVGSGLALASVTRQHGKQAAEGLARTRDGASISVRTLFREGSIPYASTAEGSVPYADARRGEQFVRRRSPRGTFRTPTLAEGSNSYATRDRGEQFVRKTEQIRTDYSPRRRCMYEKLPSARPPTWNNTPSAKSVARNRPAEHGCPHGTAAPSASAPARNHPPTRARRATRSGPNRHIATASYSPSRRFITPKHL